LLLQRLAQFLEQSGFLDGNDRLIGEVLQHCALLIGERAYLSAIDADSANDRIVLKHGHRDQRTDTSNFHRSNCLWVAVEIATILFEIDYFDRLASVKNACRWHRRTRSKHSTDFLRLRQISVPRRNSNLAVALTKPHDAVGRLTEPRRIRQHGLNHRL